MPSDSGLGVGLFQAAKFTEQSGHAVTLAAGPRLRVCDDGAPVPAALTAQLLRAPVTSDSGLGVGLFQAATFAEQSGYVLTLAENSHGSVCFELAPTG